MRNSELSSFIDHTLLKANATEVDFRKLCREAAEYSFYSVCVPGSWIQFCKEEVASTSVKICAVAGFPLGHSDTRSKVAEVSHLIEAGADEVDIVLNISKLKSGRREEVFDELKAAVQATGGHPLKVILETALLTHEEKILACELALASGAQFVKTSTGFADKGATLEDIHLMKSIVGDAMKVKASGGIRDRAFAEALIAAGASRLGTSLSVAIVTGAPAITAGY